MVDEPGKVPKLGGVHDVVQVDPEEVRAADALLLVVLLPHVGEDGADGVPHVLDDHLVGPDVLQREQSPVVDSRLSEGHLLSPELKGKWKSQSMPIAQVLKFPAVYIP